jgi:hypothetical protein
MTLVGTLALCPPYGAGAISRFNFQTAKNKGLEAVIASEAKQSISTRKERVDCFVASAFAR